MADVLSQSEIDALLLALDSGELKPEEITNEEEKQKVKLYDFRSPQKFSKDHIRTLELIYDNYSRIIANYLAAQVRTTVKVNLEYIEQTTYEEFMHSISNPTILNLFKLQPLSGTLLFETNQQFTYQIIDILLGGKGEGVYKTRSISDIDRNIIMKINQALVAHLKLAWSDVLSVEPEFEGIETNPALNQTLAPHEPVVLITLSVEIGKNSTFLNMCIPYLSVEKILDKLVFSYWYQESDENDKAETQEKIVENLNKVEVPINVLLGKSQISVHDFLSVMTGDVITLDTKCDDPLKVLVDNKVHYIAKPGVVGKKLGVQVISVNNEEVDGDD
ncbi:flagellar motor switch protein FliM [Clostridium bornimense]|uniref:Flagellar motor switch protein FliM n=1 Tax=Clostridium bornimense TaxID=1216932 RepID=W6SG68_9CLOT|nr:flagellar motor switch protein FliM [Clostridium bornimense]CDM68700.1 flagellar motor switch protein FliM [Clostridium bornimense]